jgi:4,5-DOPA dioxygenase extradiol
LNRLPVLFISHGAPTLILEPGATGPALRTLAQSLPVPKAILIVSAHWDTRIPEVSASAKPETIHDFYGFPDALYRMRYGPPGAPELAARVSELLRAQGMDCAISPERGLDHGAWVPLMLMYPDANIPVTQLSIGSHLGAAHHHALGKAISALREEGVLVIGSGAATHNLREFRAHSEHAEPPSWVTEFREWIASALSTNNVDALLDYRAQAPSGARNHPTEDHIVPLFAALGAAGANYRATRMDCGVTYGILAMDHYRFD